MQATIKEADQNDYNRVKQITVIDTNSYTYDIPSGTVSPATGAITCTSVILFGDTDINGEITDTRGYSLNQGVSGSAKKGSSKPTYISSAIAGTIDSSSGANLTILMTSDD